MFKIYNSATFDFSDDEDEMDHLSQSSGGEADWKFFGETTICIKISLNYIMGLN